ncbi:S41 family peptidase, partial [Thermotoga sp.]|uniref:S41 family peptidase n=1 Tax=Thermotoga sp. TaxID=28240 RepID=UPI0025E892CF
MKVKKFRFGTHPLEGQKEFSEFLTKVFSENKDMTDLIIDVRDNPGGSWDAPLEIISHFIDKPLIINADMYTKACEYAQKDLAAIGIRYSKELEGEIIRTKKTFTAYPKKPIFKGNVWVLANKDVFSGGKFFVYVIQKYRLGKVIGEKLLTDANITLWRPFMLPYSHIEVYIPTRMVFFGKDIEILPDYETTLTA